MTTLSSAPVAPLLARLFADADANPPAQSPVFAGATRFSSVAPGHVLATGEKAPSRPAASSRVQNKVGM